MYLAFDQSKGSRKGRIPATDFWNNLDVTLKAHFLVSLIAGVCRKVSRAFLPADRPKARLSKSGINVSDNTEVTLRNALLLEDYDDLLEISIHFLRDTLQPISEL